MSQPRSTPHPAVLLATACAALTLLVTAPAAAQQAGPQKAFPAAPAFTAKTWVQGKPTTLAEKDRLYVVEVWATWCRPCQESLPALARLQAEHADKVTMIALTDDDVGKVRPFVKQRPALSPLSVAVDPDTTRTFMKQFKVRGIPTAFLIQNKKVMWVGHPAELKPVLQRAMDGRWTPTSQAEARALAAKAQRVSEYWRNGGTLTPKARKDASELARMGKDYPMVLNNVAWLMLTETKPDARPLELALKLAEVANASSGGANFYVLDTYARALYLKGDKARAVTLQKQAIDLCAKANDQCGELSQILTRYQSGEPL